jgi:hypothetical protein
MVGIRNSAGTGMIAPARETKSAPPHSALRAARLAVADALLAPRRGSAETPGRLATWRVWLLVGGLILAAVGYALTGDWWTVEQP